MSLFTAYDACVAEILGGRPTKTQAIKLDGRAPKGFIGTEAVPRLLTCMDASCWTEPKYSTAGNWQWRSRPPDEKTESPEVGLERAIARLDDDAAARGGDRSWSYQMSTCSGLLGKHTDKRRAIDLVRAYGSDRYAFVELKVGSDNPLYAAFEILGYYLGYLRARAAPEQFKASASYDVLKASHVELVVLGPHGWFTYVLSRGATVKKRYDLTWLTDGITSGLRAVSDGNLSAGFRFDEFPDAMNRPDQAAFVVSQSGTWLDTER